MQQEAFPAIYRNISPEASGDWECLVLGLDFMENFACCSHSCESCLDWADGC